MIVIVIYPNYFCFMEVSINGGTQKNGWFTKEHPIKMDDLEIPSFLEPQFAIAVCPHQ